jgi:hypothetical protein
VQIRAGAISDPTCWRRGSQETAAPCCLLNSASATQNKAQLFKSQVLSSSWGPCTGKYSDISGVRHFTKVNQGSNCGRHLKTCQRRQTKPGRFLV